MTRRDEPSREHAWNVRKVVGLLTAPPFLLGVALTLGFLIGIGAFR